MPDPEGERGGNDEEESRLGCGQNSAGADVWHMENLWQQLGGDENMRRIINDFIDVAIADPAVNYTRNGRFALSAAGVEFAKKSALEFFSAATGGPLQYSGRSLVEIHRGMQIAEGEFDAICRDFRHALEKNGIGVPLQQIVMAKVESTRTLIVEQNITPGR